MEGEVAKKVRGGGEVSTGSLYGCGHPIEKFVLKDSYGWNGEKECHGSWTLAFTSLCTLLLGLTIFSVLGTLIWDFITRMPYVYFAKTECTVV